MPLSLPNKEIVSQNVSARVLPQVPDLRKREKVRESGIEILRIILMMQVVFLHFCDYGGYSAAEAGLSSLYRLQYWSLFLISRCPVYVYIVIFGYFAVKSNKTFKDTKPKILRTYLPILFYSLSITAIFLLLGRFFGAEVKGDPVIQTIKAFFPLLSRTWYFMTLYLLVLILSPFVNRCLTALSKNEYTALIVILFFIFSIWTVFAGLDQTKQVININKIISTQGGKGLYGFLYMYILGGYLRLHVKSHDKAKFRFLLFFFALAAVNLILVYKLPSYKNIVASNDNPISVIQGVCLVLFFRDLTFKSKVVNYIAALNLGVYMIHEHFFVRDYIWKKLFPIWKTLFSDGKMIVYQNVLYILLTCIVIFVVCACIEKIRVWIFKGVELKIWTPMKTRKMKHE